MSEIVIALSSASWKYTESIIKRRYSNIVYCGYIHGFFFYRLPRLKIHEKFEFSRTNRKRTVKARQGRGISTVLQCLLCKNLMPCFLFKFLNLAW